MVLKIRLARFGKRHAPFYNIVVAHARYAFDPPSARKPNAHIPRLAPSTLLPHNDTAFGQDTRKQKEEITSSNIQLQPTRTARGSKPLEVLGTYDPIPKTPTDGNETAKKFKDIKLDIHRAKYWLGVGAQPSEPAWRLLSMIGLMEPKFRPGQEIKKEGTAA
ncbi:unnamed protein product [Aureobasidium vineae]|uniref:Ribosomal protein S16 n=1 Tax=Aureobasidium vineae TaxID=2773715 RepID=A0A9N8JVU8_9PEZI|nr:unnamed protein product [Aureobasidium vineae]